MVLLESSVCVPERPFPVLGCAGGGRRIVVELQDVLRKNLSITLQEPPSPAHSRTRGTETRRNQGTELASIHTSENQEEPQRWSVWHPSCGTTAWQS